MRSARRRRRSVCRLTATGVLALTALAIAAPPPASAVVGGEPVPESSVPWLASFAGCGGTLVAPDRVLTAAHCVYGRNLWDLQGVGIAGTYRATVRFAMHPGWRRRNAENFVEDVALLQLDRPVEGVPLVTFGSGRPDRALIIGRGLTRAPGGGEGPEPDRGIRGAQLRTMTDAACRRSYRRRRGNGGERFIAARMLCAIDVDGRRPLASGCNGDSGGPLYTGPDTAPVQFGIVSWGGARCGADHLPSVFADVQRYRAFIADATPAWAPVPDGPARVTGRPRVGSTLTCGVESWSVQPTRVTIDWQRQGGRRTPIVGHRPTYRVRSADAGHILVCAAAASNAGGFTTVRHDQVSAVRIPR